MKVKIIPAPKCVEWGKKLNYRGISFDVSVQNAATMQKLTEISCKDGLPLHLQKVNLPTQHYRLQITSTKAEITYGDDVGLHYATLTLWQIVKRAKCLVECNIADEPDFPTRGLMIDISRNKVPKMETLFKIVDVLSDLKINMLQLYVEGRSYFYPDKAFCYDNPEDFLTENDVVALKKYCEQHFIQLVPNGNSLGHMTYWLSRKEFCHLAYSPNGFSWWENGLHCPAGTLDPQNPHSKQFVLNLFDQLLQGYDGAKLVNIGGDEPFEFSFGDNKLPDEGNVYVNYMKDIVDNMHARGLTPMMWGDVAKKYPEKLQQFGDVIFLEWGYIAGEFSDENCKIYSQSNSRFYVCPSCGLHGTFCGKTDNMLQNIKEAAHFGKKHGAEGFLNTDWGDGGTTQMLVSQMYAYAMGAAVCWNEQLNEADVEDWLDRYVYRCKLAQLVGNLGRYCNYQKDLKGGIPFLFSTLYIKQTDGLNFDKNYSDPTGFFYREDLLSFDELKQTENYIKLLKGFVPSKHNEYVKEVEAIFQVLDWAVKHSYLCWGIKNINYTAEQVQEVLNLAKQYVKTYTKLWFLRNKRSDFDNSVYRYKALTKKYKHILKNCD